jgi:hypothetical protein
LLRVPFYPDVQQQAQQPSKKRVEKCTCHVNCMRYVFD